MISDNNNLTIDTAQAAPDLAPNNNLPPAKLTEEGLDLLSQNFKSLDKNNSGTLDRDELIDVVYGENTALGSTALVLWMYNKAFSYTASPENDQYKWKTGTVRNAYLEKFCTDIDGEGVSKKDIDLMRWTLDKNATDDYLKSLKIKEMQDRALSGKSAGTFESLTAKSGVPQYSKWIEEQRKFLQTV